MDLLALGLTLGMANALLAVGLVLVHLSTRVINFAHGELGAFAVAMMLMLVRAYHWPYWPSLVLSLAATAALAAIIERTVIRRLFTSPRLLVMLATIGIAQIVTVGRLSLPKPKINGDSVFIGGGTEFPVPFHSNGIQFGRVVFGPAHLMVLVGGPLLALGVFLFLRSSIYGVAIRAAAENSSRARLLGIPVGRVSTISWALSGLLAGAGALLLAPISGFTASEAVGLPLLVRALAAATLAGFTSVGAAFGWGLVFGLVDELTLYYTGKSGLTDAVTVAMVLGLLLLRREQRRRTTAAEESSWQVAEPVRALPDAIRRHATWKAASLLAIVIAVGVILSAPFLLTPSQTYLLASICATSIVTVAITVLSGWSGQLSLGHWAIAGCGAVLGSRLTVVWHVSFWLAFAASAVVGIVVALLLGLPALRLPGTLLAVVTLGFGVACSAWLFSERWFAGDGHLDRPAWITTRYYYAITVVSLATALIAVRTLQRARIGRNLIAVRDNPVQAAAMGIGVTRTKLTGFMISGVLASMGGFLWAAGAGATDSRAFPAIRSLGLLSAAIIGGLGSIGGAILGTAYLLGIPYFAAERYPLLGILTTGVGLLLLIVVFPGGLARLLFGLRDLIAGKLTGLDPRPTVQPATVTDDLIRAAERVESNA